MSRFLYKIGVICIFVLSCFPCSPKGSLGYPQFYEVRGYTKCIRLRYGFLCCPGPHISFLGVRSFVMLAPPVPSDYVVRSATLLACQVKDLDVGAAVVVQVCFPWVLTMFCCLYPASAMGYVVLRDRR